MPVNNETLNKHLYDALRSKGYDPVALNSQGEPNYEVENADVFRFSFENDDKKLYAWATIEGNDLNIYIDDEILKTPNFDDFAKYMKVWAQRKLLGFKITNKDHLEYDMRKRTNQKNKEKLGEGYYPMGKKASYNDSVPQVKIILQHTRQIEEGEQRFRNVAKIFVENTNGERFLLPTTRPGLARVYARHVAEGGTPYDDKGKHITNLIEEYTKMAGFVRATRNGQFNESALRLVNEGLKHYNDLRMTLQGMASHRGYNKYFESYTPVLNEESEDSSNLTELFVQEKLDPRIESVMPILNRLSKNITEMSAVKELEEWAVTVTEVEDQTTKTLAEPAEDELNEGRDDLIDSLDEVVMRRIMHSHPELLKDLDNLEMAIADEVAFFVGDGVEEVGSSDVSGIVKAVVSRMSERGVDLDEAPGAETLAHNQSTEKSNLQAFDLAEGPADEPVEPNMDADDKRWDDVEEGLDANQKRAGQLGPTEPVGKNEKNLRGKLVGANESSEGELNKIIKLAGTRK